MQAVFFKKKLESKIKNCKNVFERLTEILETQDLLMDGRKSQSQKF